MARISFLRDSSPVSQALYRQRTVRTSQLIQRRRSASHYAGGGQPALGIVVAVLRLRRLNRDALMLRSPLPVRPLIYVVMFIALFTWFSTKYYRVHVIGQSAWTKGWLLGCGMGRVYLCAPRGRSGIDAPISWSSGWSTWSQDIWMPQFTTSPFCIEVPFWIPLLLLIVLLGICSRKKKTCLSNDVKNWCYDSRCY